MKGIDERALYSLIFYQIDGLDVTDAKHILISLLQYAIFNKCNMETEDMQLEALTQSIVSIFQNR